MNSVASKVKERALELGFIKIGFSRPRKPLFYDNFCLWVSSKKNADMAWLEKHLELRSDPSMLLDGCKTIISLAYPYSPKRPGTPEGYYVSVIPRQR
jgi:epoxyqueuosine reductase